MKSAIKNTAFVIASITLIFGSVTMMQKSKAAANIFTGKCGGVFNLRTAADGVLPIGNDKSISASLIIDFDNNKASVASTRQTKVDADINTWSQDMRIDKSIILEQDPDGMIGAYQITIGFVDGVSPDNPVLRLIPVNNSSTFLIQGKNVGASGVCQKV